MSIHAAVRSVSFERWRLEFAAEELGDIVVNELSNYAPKVEESIVGRQVITPLDLERHTVSAAGTFITARCPWISYSLFAR